MSRFTGPVWISVTLLVSRDNDTLNSRSCPWLPGAILWAWPWRGHLTLWMHHLVRGAMRGNLAGFSQAVFAFFWRMLRAPACV